MTAARITATLATSTRDNTSVRAGRVQNTAARVAPAPATNPKSTPAQGTSVQDTLAQVAPPALSSSSVKPVLVATLEPVPIAKKPKPSSGQPGSQPPKRKANDGTALELASGKFEADFLPSVSEICKPYTGSSVSMPAKNLAPTQSRTSIADYSTVLEPDVSERANICNEESILLRFKPVIFTSLFACDKPYRSLTWVNKINPKVPLCPYELDGVCNDASCIYQHQSQYKPSEAEALKASTCNYALTPLII